MLTRQFINKIIFIVHRKRRLKNTERKSGKIRRERSKSCQRTMRDLLTKWPQLWDSPVLARKRSDRTC